MVVWSATALALVALVFGAVQLTLNVLPSADAVAGSLAGSVVPPSPQAVAVPTRPPIVAQSVHQSMATLGGSGTPITAASGPELLAGTNAGLASLGPSVQFDYDSAAIRSDAVARIDELAAAIATRNLTGVIFVHGYTDNLGSHEHGILLSTQRAENVARILQERLEGRPVQLVTAGYGEADPVGDNATPEGQSLNRRVLVLYRPSA
jgi:outer membrane protein OmpA-like peptidoglycan-associated protein